MPSGGEERYNEQIGREPGKEVGLISKSKSGAGVSSDFSYRERGEPPGEERYRPVIKESSCESKKEVFLGKAFMGGEGSLSCSRPLPEYAGKDPLEPGEGRNSAKNPTRYPSHR